MKKQVIVSFVFAFLILSSCTNRLARLERSNDWSQIYRGAIAYYEQGKYNKAKLLFERISPYFRGSVEAEKVQFYWAYCEYHQKLYQLSAYRFKSFFETYGRSDFAEEAEFMYAYSLFKDVPEPNLDQNSSREAAVATQNFLNRRPGSKYYTQANEMIDELQVRFETKAYETAKLYYKLSTGLSYRNYLEAALVTMETFKNDFPDSKYNEELLFLSIKTEYRLAENSIESKKKERVDKTIAYYNEFIEKYPNSEYLTEAKSLHDKSLKELNNGK